MGLDFFYTDQKIEILIRGVYRKRELAFKGKKATGEANPREHFSREGVNRP